MKLAVALILVFCCVNCGSGYIFPICSEDKSCTSHFTLPNIPSIAFINNIKPAGVSIIMDDKVESLTALILRNLLALTDYCKEHIIRTYILVIKKLPPISEEYMHVLKYIPLVKYEEKAKADGKLYLLFIITSLGIYLALYLYFVRKLYYYYQTSLREQYLNNIKKIFKTKE